MKLIKKILKKLKQRVKCFFGFHDFKIAYGDELCRHCGSSRWFR